MVVVGGTIAIVRGTTSKGVDATDGMDLAVDDNAATDGCDGCEATKLAKTIEVAIAHEGAMGVGTCVAMHIEGAHDTRLYARISSNNKVNQVTFTAR